MLLYFCTAKYDGYEGAYETPIESFDSEGLYTIWADPGNGHYWRAGSNDSHLDSSRFACLFIRKIAETNHATVVGMPPYSRPALIGWRR